jgi:hypothetical protein
MVGSYKTGTLITMHVGADFLVVLDTMPTTETANSIGTKMPKWWMHCRLTRDLFIFARMFSGENQWIPNFP